MSRSKTLTLVVLFGLLVGLCLLMFLPSEEPATQAQESGPVQLDDSGAVATYANVCRVTGTEREIFFDFAVDSGPAASGDARDSVSRRIVTNLYTAKRMLHALKLTVRQHEAAFGVIHNQDGANQESGRIGPADSAMLPSYTNFCRVTGTPEEVILDFGLHLEPFGVPTQPIQINYRVITNFHTAKLVTRALDSALAQHEAAHGVIETDVQKRVRPEAFGPVQP